MLPSADATLFPRPQASICRLGLGGERGAVESDWPKTQRPHTAQTLDPGSNTRTIRLPHIVRLPNRLTCLPALRLIA